MVKILKQQKIKFTAFLTSLLTLFNNVIVFAAPGDKDAVKKTIEDTGLYFWDIILTVVKWGASFALVFLVIALYMNADETAGKRLKIGLVVVVVALVIALVAQPFVRGAMSV